MRNEAFPVNQKNRRIIREAKSPSRQRIIRIEFSSFTEPEQLVLLKNFELDEKYHGRWTHEAIMENKELILKFNHIILSRVMYLFSFTMPRALMLDELEAWFFKFNFNDFWRRWMECQKNLQKWSKKDREDFLRDIKVNPKTEKSQTRE